MNVMKYASRPNPGGATPPERLDGAMPFFSTCLGYAFIEKLAAPVAPELITTTYKNAQLHSTPRATVREFLRKIHALGYVALRWPDGSVARVQNVPESFGDDAILQAYDKARAELEKKYWRAVVDQGSKTAH